MKKIITFLMAATMIIGFAGIATAADTCFTCVEPGIIDRACDIAEQGSCYSEPFDYEDKEWCEGPSFNDNYCTESKLPRRVVFPACNCDNFVEGDTIDIRMEILVNGLPGNNGAYWAQQVDSIDVGTYNQAADACSTDELDDSDCIDYDTNDGPNAFEGPFEYLYYNDAGGISTRDGDIDEGGMSCADISAADRVTIIQPDAEEINGECVDHGYVITQEDDLNNNAYWAINIPFMRFDQTIIQAGDVVTVKICLGQAVMVGTIEDEPCYDVDLGGICNDAACCCEFVVGTLGCCDSGATYGLLYPYATPMNSLDWWYGMVITNVDGIDGEADITVYETNADGSVDTATITVAVSAHSLYVTNNQSLMAAFGGDIGDGRAYFEVNTDFDASGFLFIGNDMKAEAMGYLPESFSDYYKD